MSFVVYIKRLVKKIKHPRIVHLLYTYNYKIWHAYSKWDKDGGIIAQLAVQG